MISSLYHRNTVFDIVLWFITIQMICNNKNTKSIYWPNNTSSFHFYPRPVLAFGYCRCLCVCPSVCVSINPELVRAITHHTFKLEPPNLANLDKICKTIWLRSLLLFSGWGWDGGWGWGRGGGGAGGGVGVGVVGEDWHWPSRSKLTWKVKFTPFRACPRHNSPLIQARTNKSGQQMQTSLHMALIFLGGWGVGGGGGGVGGWGGEVGGWGGGLTVTFAVKFNSLTG